jgi:hypothetical protein
MAKFVWDPAVQWPPPAHVLLSYDVVDSNGAVLSPLPASKMEEANMTQPFLALITPLAGNYPDQGPPGGEHPGNRPPGSWDGAHPGNRPPGSWDGAHPGNRPPGSWGGEYPGGGPVYPGRPADPGYDRPDWAPGHPGNRPPGSWSGEHPGNRPPGSWSGEYPGGGPAPGRPPGYVTGGPIEPPAGGTPVPPEQMPPPAEPPPELAEQIIVSIYKPGEGWTTTAYDATQPKS